MTDHKAEAENFLSAVIIPNGEPPEVYIGMAQVSATLYLAEQQRIANLIAGSQIHIWPTNERGESSCNPDDPETQARIAVSNEWKSQIREGLGL